MMSVSWSRLNTGLLLLVLVAIIGLFASRAYGGPLDPTGPPAPTDSVKLPGTPISSLPFVISQPGHYYLTRNLGYAGPGDGITISAEDVTLDLMGFELSGSGSASAAISSGGGVWKHWAVRNGTIREWPFNAIWAPGVETSVYEDLRVFGNGGPATAPALLLGDGVMVHDVQLKSNFTPGGIKAGARSRVSDCTVEGTGAGTSTGIELGQYGSIHDCAVVEYDTGIAASSGGQVRDCLVSKGTALSGTGISLGDRSSLDHCSVNGFALGILAGASSDILNCKTTGAGSTPVNVKKDSSVSDCMIVVGGSNWGLVSDPFGGDSVFRENQIKCTDPPSGRGVLPRPGDWVDGNRLSGCFVGVDAASSTGSAITRNRCRAVTTCVSDGADDDVAPLGAASSALTNPWSNIVD